MGQGLGGGELGGAVLALVRPVRRVLGAHVVLEGHAVDESLLATNLALYTPKFVSTLL